MIHHKSTLIHAVPPIKTKVHIGKELLYSLETLNQFRQFPGRIAVITDTHVKTLIAEKWISFLKHHKIDAHLFSFSAGEESKNRHTKERIEDEMFQERFGRDTLLVAMGGGVVTDLAGFLSSTFARGIPLVLIPTTLMGMVDAAIGGKTAVNTPFGKNLIGTLYPPQSIILDTSTLSTLPERQWRNGMAEIIKYGLISSPPLFHKLLNENKQWNTRDPEWINEIIYDSFLIKKHVIETDFQESGYRRILNFGHTIAHALETIENYRIPHGEAVAVGMLIEGIISHRMGLLQQEDLEKIKEVLTLYEFPLKISPHVNLERLVARMNVDKKSQSTHPRFVLLKTIGEVVSFDGAYCGEVPECLLEEVLTEVLKS